MLPRVAKEMNLQRMLQCRSAWTSVWRGRALRQQYVGHRGYTTVKETETNSNAAAPNAVKGRAAPTSMKARESPSPFDSLGMSLNTSLQGTRAVIEGLGPTSFTINGVRVSGSVMLMPLYSTIWNIDKWEDVCAEAFTLVKISVPTPDILIFGTGETALPVSDEIHKWFADIGVGLEVMSTKNAAHTFNVLNQESRNIGAALLPMSYTA